ncbi:MAG: hypothetical protein K2X00_24195 [Nitrospiraceae bacterium]|nr:hypothetical protein [Nitrospiraceae bacterium]
MAQSAEIAGAELAFERGEEAEAGVEEVGPVQIEPELPLASLLHCNYFKVLEITHVQTHIFDINGDIPTRTLNAVTWLRCNEISALLTMVINSFAAWNFAGIFERF